MKVYLTELENYVMDALGYFNYFRRDDIKINIIIFVFKTKST